MIEPHRQRLDSTDVELLALLWTLIAVLCDRERNETQLVQIWSDSKSAIDLVAGRAVSGKEDKLAMLARIAYRVARARGALEVYHIKSHCFHHWNMLADNVAKQAAQQHIQGI
eukprot:1080669-Pyramimonas_sp.AAC.1